MNLPTFNGLKDDFTRKRHDLMCAKRDDYATDNVLHNFDAVALLTGLTPLQVAVIYKLKGLTAICNSVFHDKTLKVETLESRLIDDGNYTDICYVIMKEGNDSKLPFKIVRDSE